MLHKKILIFFIILPMNFNHIFALDITTGFNIGNLGFNIDTNSSAMALIWGSSILFEQKLDGNFLFSGGLVIDDITGNRIDSRLTFKSSYIDLGIGPSLAAVNNNQLQLKPAINGIVKVKIDGIFFLTSEIYSTFGNLSDKSTDYSQLHASLALGIYIPSAICTFTIENKQYTQFYRDASSIESKTSDFYSVYKLEADIHKKNIPFHLILTFGYRDLQRIFPINDINNRSLAGIGSAFLGMATKINIGEKIIVNIGIDSGIYNFTLSDEIAPNELPLYLFNTYLSFTYKF